MAYDSRSITLKEYRLLFLKTTRASPKCLWVPRICSGSHGLIWDEKLCRSPILAIAVVDTHGKFSCRFTACKDEPFKEYVPQLPRPDPLTNPQAPAHLLSATSWFFKTTPTYEHSTLQENQNGRKPRRPPFFSHNKPGCEETAEPWPIFFFSLFPSLEGERVDNNSKHLTVDTRSWLIIFRAIFGTHPLRLLHMSSRYWTCEYIWNAELSQFNGNLTKDRILEHWCRHTFIHCHSHPNLLRTHSHRQEQSFILQDFVKLLSATAG